MSNPILGAIQQLASEKNIPLAIILETVEAALAAAYRKDFGQKNQNIKVTFEPKTGAMEVFDVKTVCEDHMKLEWETEQTRREAEAAAAIAAGLPLPEYKVEMPTINPDGTIVEVTTYNPKTMLSVTDAQLVKAGAVAGDELKIALPIPGEFGRMAAQTAKQVVIQRLREAEREALAQEYETKVGTLVMGTVHRPEGRALTVDLGNIIAYFPPEEQVPFERYRMNNRLRFYVVSLNRSGKGPIIIVSRAHPELVRQLFMSEVPEVAAGTVRIKGIAREAGLRTKVAVESMEETVDPIGASVGQRGTRVQTIIRELGGEKIDIILYDEDPAIFLANALAPAKVEKIELNVAAQTARAIVPADQVPLAIGRNGQNVRLAAKLTNWRIDIVPKEEPEHVVASSEMTPEEAAVAEAAAAPVTPAVVPIVVAKEETTPETPTT